MQYLTRAMTAGVPPTGGSLNDREQMIAYAVRRITRASGPLVEGYLVRDFGITAPMARGIIQQAQLRARKEGRVLYHHGRTMTDRKFLVTKDTDDAD